MVHLAISPNGSTLVLQQASALLVSRDDGIAWSVLTAWPQPPGQVAAPGGVAVLSDGGILVAAVVPRPGTTTASIYASRGQQTATGWQWSPYVAVGNGSFLAGAGTSRRFVTAAGSVNNTSTTTLYYAAPTVGPGVIGPRTTIFASVDNGWSFVARGNLPRWTIESDLLPLDDGVIIAVSRYQTKNATLTPTVRASLGHAVGPRYQNTLLSKSTDAGATWSAVGLVTGFAQLDASLVRVPCTAALPAIVVNYLQRDGPSVPTSKAIVSYDGGDTFSNLILALPVGGTLGTAVSVGNGRVVSVLLNGTTTTVARWKLPPRKNVTAGGSFRPLPVQFPTPIIRATSPPRAPPTPGADVWDAPKCPPGGACAWAVYAPTVIPWSPSAIFKLSTTYFIEPAVVIGPDDELLVQSTSNIFRSTDGGGSFGLLCPFPKAPAPGSSGPNGVGLLRDGTVLVSRWYYASAANVTGTAQLKTVVHRAGKADIKAGSCGWSPGIELTPINSPGNSVGGGLSTRFAETADGDVLLTIGNVEIVDRQGSQLPVAERFHFSVVYRSTNGGLTFAPHGRLANNTAETDVLPLSNGTLLATSRFQTDHFVDEKQDTVAVSNATSIGYKNTVVMRSEDGGRTFSEPAVVTGIGQQTGSLVRLSTGVLVLPFSHKDAGEGQRFIVSYDQGISWSNTVFNLNTGGLYAASVALKNDTIVTAFSCAADPQSACVERAGMLTILQWELPPKATVSAGGFFRPVIPYPAG